MQGLFARKKKNILSFFKKVLDKNKKKCKMRIYERSEGESVSRRVPLKKFGGPPVLGGRRGAVYN
jgi:hypothetical protein